MKATIQSVSKIGQSEQIGVSVVFSDGAQKEFQFPVSATKDEIKDVVKAEVARLKTIEGQVANLQELVGKEFN